MSAKNLNIMGAIIFMAIGLVSGFVTDMLIGSMGWEVGLLSTFISFAVFFGLLVYMGKAKMGMRGLMVFSIIGFISSYASGFLGDIWGITGSMYGSILSFLIFFVALALLGTKQTGVTTT